MSDIVRLTLVSHGMTDAMAAGRFPLDEPLSDLGRRQAATAAPVGTAFSGPEQRTLQTSALLGLAPRVEPALADLDCGRWRGLSLDEVAPGELGSWLADPAGAPHGGESIVELIDRVRGWMETLTADPVRVVAVTHPAVIRAAILTVLDAPPAAFWRVDIAPVSQTVLHRRGPGWTWRSGPPAIGPEPTSA